MGVHTGVGVVLELAALLLTVVAGGDTGTGAAPGLLGRSTYPKLLAGGLGLSAGAMLYVSFMELLAEGARVLSRGADRGTGHRRRRARLLLAPAQR